MSSVFKRPARYGAVRGSIFSWVMSSFRSWLMLPNPPLELPSPRLDAGRSIQKRLETKGKHMTQVLHQVHIRKEGLPLKTNESVQEFARTINDAARTAFTTKFSIAKGKGDIYAMEVYGSSIIFEVFKYEEPDSSQRCRYYAATYKRKDD